MTRTLPLLTDRIPSRCREKEMPLVGIEKALSESTRKPPPSRRALKFSVSFSAAIIVFCSSIAIIQSQTAFWLGDVCSSRELSITKNLSNWGLFVTVYYGRLLLTDKRFHVDRAGATTIRFPGSLFLTTFQSLKTNFTRFATILLYSVS
jgi:hypothetical protein